ncbi:hypothetical protein A7A08_02086 [Methyloligella halotolerans]|uniref:Uncharacterized protein n=1 Tax=Methyloligella halotolerans TaxID=1177755 RepID=A0A1E2RXK6_9HYPH|nr:DUF1045 domain-containing protein [Methyloligella halotolerans]ODA66789.1 hypothetical protein A7A08_02086 [Methyloligella halotolerans]
MLNQAAVEYDPLDAPLPRLACARFGISFTPKPNTALAAFGRSWFGYAGASTYHAFSGAGLSSRGGAKVPAMPGHYAGLHATLKAPFMLRRGKGPDALRSRLKEFAKRRKPVATGPLDLAREGRFLVLRAKQENPALDWLAIQVVSGFDGFADESQPVREDAETDRLNPYQRLLLGSFGDINVMSEFRFSLRLTGPMEPAQIERVAEALLPVLERICAEGIEIDALSLLGDPGGRSPLRLLKRYPLAG